MQRKGGRFYLTFDSDVCGCYSKLTHMIVYLLTNTVNGKGYVGATVESLNQRWSSHLVDSKRYSSPLYRAFEEFGTSVFDRRILSVALNLDVLNALEDFWIRELNTLSPNGYNGKGGGKKGFFVTQEGRDRMSARMLGTKMWVGKKHTPETRAKLVLAHLGKRPTSETRVKMGEAQKVAWAKRKADGGTGREKLSPESLAARRAKRAQKKEMQLV